MTRRARSRGLWVIMSIVGQLGSACLGVPMGTAITYQGRFTNGGSPADGAYDFEFRLFDASTAGNQVGNTVTKGDLTVADGYFTAALDFGTGAFGGEARWLQIAVRPGAQTGAYTTLTPRHELTPTPYTLYSAVPGTANYMPKFTSAGLTDSVLYESGGKVGVGTTTPAEVLQVAGDLQADGALVGTRYIARGVYNYTQGILISTDIAVSDNRMIELYLEGNSYSSWGPVNARVQAYNYTGTGTIIVTSYTACGMAPPEVRVFHHEGFVKFWMAPTRTYQTYRFTLATHSGYRKITSIQHSAMPGTGVTNQVILTPKTLLNNLVGIGTISPQNLLHVNSDTANNVARFESTDPAALILLKDNNTTCTGEAICRIGDDLDLRSNDMARVWVKGATGYMGVGTGTPQVMLDVAGDIRCVDLTETSDEQLKTDVQPLGGVLSRLEQVRAVSFQWNEKARSLGAASTARQIGVLAQELEQVFPELVRTPEPATLEQLLRSCPEEALTPEVRQRLQNDAERSQYKAVSYSKLTVVLLEAVKELQAQNRALEQRIQALEGAAR